MKILNFPDSTTIFLLRDINCYTRIQSIKKSHEIASSYKQTFQKLRPYELGRMKIELINQDK